MAKPTLLTLKTNSMDESKNTSKLHEDAKKLYWKQMIDAGIMKGPLNMQEALPDAGSDHRFLVIEDFNGTIALCTDGDGNTLILGSLHEAQKLADECQHGVVVPLDLLREIFSIRAKRISLHAITLIPGNPPEHHDYLFIN